MTENGKSEIQGEAWVRSMLSLPRPPAALVFMDEGRAKVVPAFPPQSCETISCSIYFGGWLLQRWSSIYEANAGMFGVGVPVILQGLATTDNSTSLPKPLRFLHPDCRDYAAKHGLAFILGRFFGTLFMGQPTLCVR